MPKFRIILGTVLAGILAILVLPRLATNRAPGSADSDRATRTEPDPPAHRLSRIRPDASPESSPPAETAPPEALQEARDRILADIHQASIQYEPSQIPAIAAHLLHPDPEVRKAAIDGLIVLGEREAAAPLRDAAKQVEDPREATLFLDAADYLELPSYRLRRKADD